MAKLIWDGKGPTEVVFENGGSIYGFPSKAVPVDQDPIMDCLTEAHRHVYEDQYQPPMAIASRSFWDKVAKAVPETDLGKMAKDLVDATDTESRSLNAVEGD